MLSILFFKNYSSHWYEFEMDCEDKFLASEHVMLFFFSPKLPVVLSSLSVFTTNAREKEKWKHGILVVFLLEKSNDENIR
jgi:hypothetical protein